MFKKVTVAVVLSATLLFGLSSQPIEAANVRHASHHSTVRVFNINRSGQNWLANIFRLLTGEFEQENTRQPDEDQVEEQIDNQEKEEVIEENQEPEKEVEENKNPVEEVEQPQAPEHEVDQSDNQEETETTTEPVGTPEAEAPVEPTPAEPEKEQTEPTEEVRSNLNAFEQQVVELTNQERTARGLQPLAIDESLSAVAREKSNDMARNRYFSHNSPTYGSPFDMMQQFGVSYRTAGENIARGQRSPEEVVNGWMNSEGHRANILNPNFTHIGVGYVEGSNHWTQMFIGK